MIHLFNTLTKEKEVFTPLKANQVGMYVCGPTVYDRAHIGNARAVVVFDALYRFLQHMFKSVIYVRNITDVDDKINAAAKERNIPISELTEQTTTMFHSDMEALNCLNPDKEPRATEHIPEMIKMIETLVANGSAYEAEQHVLFDVTSFDRYGNLSRRSRDEMVAGARVEVAPYKKDPADFVLWKPSTNDEPGWNSPWGRGRPGWHLECSVMSTQYLGDDFDIHGGGIDLQFPHHENEIAQSCCAHKNSKFAHYWIHNGFLTVEGEKMSKSLGNFITVHDLLEKGIEGEVIRFALLGTHYRKPLDFSEKLLHDAKKSLDGFYRAIESVKEDSDFDSEYSAQFWEALNDDINTPKAIAILHDLSAVVNKSKGAKKETYSNELRRLGKHLGFFSKKPDIWFGKGKNNHIESLISLREKARQEKNWGESDRIRDQLKNEGIILEDNPDGTTSWRKL